MIVPRSAAAVSQKIFLFPNPSFSTVGNPRVCNCVSGWSQKWSAQKNLSRLVIGISTYDIMSFFVGGEVGKNGERRIK